MQVVISISKLQEFQREYTTLCKVVEPCAEILDRIGFFEQYFDMIDLGEILINDEGYEYA